MDLTAKDIAEMIFKDGIDYGDDGASHLCEYTKEERTALVQQYAEEYHTKELNAITELQKSASCE